jgi:hypothetical protein
MDALEYTARCWRASGRILASCARYEERFGLDASLLDSVDEKVTAFSRDPRDEAAKAELAVALAAFLAAALQAAD